MDFEIISPATCKELKQMLINNQGKNIRIGAGFTDLIIDMRKNNPVDLTVINLSQLKEKEFTTVQTGENEIRIGALTTTAAIIKNAYLTEHFPVLTEAASGLASGQIREVATIGGNVCQASPSGDLSCAIASLKACFEIMDMNGNIRTEALTDFFKGPGKTNLCKNEVLRSIVIPVNKGKINKSGFIKIGKRASMECSVVSLAYHILAGPDDTIVSAGIACGAVAPTVVFCDKAAALLTGKKINNIPYGVIEQFAALVQQAASPIDDIRASAWYRKEVLFNSAKSIF
ncbi:MAG: FAD binding domain-containing protein [Bacteroidetes bacterium]|nr:FAD binding domain-containing protein [Bacteroidota bacterium]